MRVLTVCVMLAAPAAGNESFREVARLEGHAGPATKVAFSADGRLLASASHDRTVRLWRTDDWTAGPVLEGNGSQLWTVAFAPDGRHLAAAGDGVVRLWRVGKSLKRAWRVAKDLPVASARPPMPGTVFDLAFAPDSKLLVAGTIGAGVRLWRARRWREGDPLTAHKAPPGEPAMVEFVDFAPDGTLLVTGGKTRETLVWAKGKKGWTVRRTLPEPEGQSHRMCARFSRDGARLAVGGTDGRFEVFDTATWKRIADVRAFPGSFVNTLAFTPDGRRLLAADAAVKAWDTETWKQVAVLDNKTVVQHMAFAPDGPRLACALVSGAVLVVEFGG